MSGTVQFPPLSVPSVASRSLTLVGSRSRSAAGLLAARTWR
ncbi:MAG: hypothetical protein FD153_1453, partial [Rhodospirillaceae bacterium]